MAGEELFGVANGKSKKEKPKGGKCRRLRKLEQLRKEKRDLRKVWNQASPEEAASYSATYAVLSEGRKTRGLGNTVSD